MVLAGQRPPQLLQWFSLCLFPCALAFFFSCGLTHLHLILILSQGQEICGPLSFFFSHFNQTLRIESNMKVLYVSCHMVSKHDLMQIRMNWNWNMRIWPFVPSIPCTLVQMSLQSGYNYHLQIKYKSTYPKRQLFHCLSKGYDQNLLR